MTFIESLILVYLIIIENNIKPESLIEQRKIKLKELLKEGILT